MENNKEELEELEYLRLKAKAAAPQRPISNIESLAGGLAQSASFGFADELESGVRAAFDPEKEYADVLPTIRDRYKAEEEANPKSYFAGEIGGAFVPGMGLARGAGMVGKGAVKALTTTAGRVGAGAAEGALTGIGRSEDKDVNDALIGGAVGGAAGYVGGKIADRFTKKIAPVADDIVSEAAPIADDSVKALKETAEATFGSPEQKINADKIKKSWEMLAPNTEMPSYLTANDREVKRLADTVLQSTSMAGAAERRALRPGIKGAEQVAEELAASSQNITKAEAGRQIRSRLSQEFEKSIEPAEKIYESLESQFKGVPIRKNAINRSLNRMDKEIGNFDLSGKSKSLIEKMRSFSGGIEDVEQLRKVRTSLNKAFDFQSLTDNEKQVVSEFYGVLTRERNRSILANALEGGVKDMDDLARQDAASILSKLKEADSIYSNSMGKFSQLPISARKGAGNASKIRNYLSEETPVEQYVSDLFDSGDIEGLTRMQKQFPDVFEILRKRAIGESVEKATNPLDKTVNPRALIKNMSSVKNPEASKLILGDSQAKVEAAGNIYGSIPETFNPSGTATKLADYNLFNPSAVARQAEMAANRGLLRSGKVSEGSAEAAFSAAKRLNPMQVITNIRNKGGEKSAQILSEALKRGGQDSYAATYFLMGQSDPEFQRLMQDDE